MSARWFCTPRQSITPQEIEVSLLGADPGAERVHSAVLERSLNGRTFYAATYPELPAGEYQVWCDGSPRLPSRRVPSPNCESSCSD